MSTEPTDDLNWLRAKVHELVEAKHIQARDPERLAVFVHRLGLGDPAYLAAEKAGFSGGNPRNDEERVRNLSAAASRYKKSGAVQKLMTAYAEWQAGQGAEALLPGEILEVLSETVRRGSGNEKIQASKLLLEHHARQGKRAGEYSLADVCAEMMRPSRPALVRVLGAAGAVIEKRAGSPDFRRVSLPEDLHQMFDRKRDLALPVLLDMVEVLKGVGNGRNSADGDLQDGARSDNGSCLNGVAETAGRTAGIEIDERFRVAGGVR